MDPYGNLAARYGYGPYGQTVVTHGPDSNLGYLTVAEGNPFRYTGAYLDSTGLYKMGARYYDPARGWFTQLDPLGGGYVYASDDPVNFTDPTGLYASPPIMDVQVHSAEAYNTGRGGIEALITLLGFTGADVQTFDAIAVLIKERFGGVIGSLFAQDVAVGDPILRMPTFMMSLTITYAFGGPQNPLPHGVYFVELYIRARSVAGDSYVTTELVPIRTNTVRI